MPRRRFPLFALSLAALPVAASAQEVDISGGRILACEADRSAEGCATLLSQLYVCSSAPEMAGCAQLLALRDAAVELDEREAELNDAEPEETDSAEGIVTEPEDEELDVEVRAEGELVDELEDEALTEFEERLREDDENDAAGQSDDESADARDGDDASTAESPDALEAATEESAATQETTATEETTAIDASAAQPDDAAAAEAGSDATATGTDAAATDGTGDEATEGADADPGDSAGDSVPGTNDAAETDGAVAPDDACPVLDSSEWAAWVNAMPGPDGPRLIVTGVVTLPSPGFTVNLVEGASDRSAQPVQIVQMSIEHPELDAAQVISDYDVRFEMPSAAPADGTTSPFSAVRIVCAEQEIAVIDPVEVAQ